MGKIIRYSLINAVSTALYITIIAIFLNSAERHFAYSRSVLIPIFMLLLFVFSAALTGTMVFGRPILWYLDNRKKDALSLLFWTITFLFILMVLAFLSISLFAI